MHEAHSADERNVARSARSKRNESMRNNGVAPLRRLPDPEASALRTCSNVCFA